MAGGRPWNIFAPALSAFKFQLPGPRGWLNWLEDENYVSSSSLQIQIQLSASQERQEVPIVPLLIGRCILVVRNGDRVQYERGREQFQMNCRI